MAKRDSSDANAAAAVLANALFSHDEAVMRR